MQASKQASKQTSKQANKQTDSQAPPRSCGLPPLGQVVIVSIIVAKTIRYKRQEID